MEVIDKTKDKQKPWQLDDVVKKATGIIGVVIKDDSEDYMILPLEGEKQYKTYLVTSYRSLSELQNNSLDWHKVNAKLVIE